MSGSEAVRLIVSPRGASARAPLFFCGLDRRGAAGIRSGLASRTAAQPVRLRPRRHELHRLDNLAYFLLTASRPEPTLNAALCFATRASVSDGGELVAVSVGGGQWKRRGRKGKRR